MKIDKPTLLFSLYGIIIIFAFCFVSCGARKVSKQSSKEETKTESIENSTIDKQVDTNVKTTTTVKIDDKNQTVTEETILEPANSSKESFVIEKDGTKVILNNAKKIVRKTTQNNNTKSETNQYVDSVQKEIEKEKKAIQKKYTTKKEITSKQVEKKQFNWFSLWWLYLIILGLLYFFRKSIPILKLIP